MPEIQKNVLDPATHIGLVTLAVSSLERSLRYYQDGLGFTVKEQKERTRTTRCGYRVYRYSHSLSNQMHNSNLHTLQVSTTSPFFCQRARTLDASSLTSA